MTQRPRRVAFWSQAKSLIAYEPFFYDASEHYDQEDRWKGRPSEINNAAWDSLMNGMVFSPSI